MAAQQDLTFDPFGDVLLMLSTNNPARPNEELEVKVSSRHLALASDVFRVMFDGGFKERIEPGGDIKRIPLPEDDAEAMMILLSVIHGLGRRVPKTIGLRTFVAIGILVDKYQLLEAVEVYIDRWFRSLWAFAEYQSSVGLANWVFLCWLCKKAPQFEMVTRRAIYNAYPGINKRGLPLPETILLEIAARRTTAIEGLLRYLEKTIDRYAIWNEPQCSSLCDCLVLGNLIKNLGGVRLYPLCKAKDITVPVKSVFSSVRDLEFVSLCQKAASISFDLDAADSKSYSNPQVYACTLKSGIHNEIARLESQIRGLDLKNLNPAPTKKRRLETTDGPNKRR